MDQEEREDAFGADGERYLRGGRYQQALASFQAALEIARQRGDPAAVSVWLGNCGTVHLALRELAQAHQRFDEAAKLAHEVGQREHEMQMRRSDAISLFEQHQPELARQALVTALEIARELADRSTEAELVGYLGIASSMTGSYEAAARHYADALDVARDLGNTSQTGVITGNLANNFMMLGDSEHAVRHFEEALRIARDVGDHENEEKWKAGLEAARRQLEIEDDPMQAAAADYQRALRSHGVVPPEQAVEFWLRAARSCRVARDYAHCADCLANAGMLLNELGQFAEAERRFDEALDVLNAVADPRRTGLTLMNRAVSLRDRGEADRAVDTLGEAIRFLRAGAAPTEVAWALTILAGLHVDRQEQDAATPLFDEAAQIYRAEDDKEQLAGTLMQLGSAVCDDDRAEALLREAVEVARAARSPVTLVNAVILLAMFLKDHRGVDAALTEVTAFRAQVTAEAPAESVLRYLLLLGQLLAGDEGASAAIDAYNEALEIADRLGDVVASAAALTGICTAYSAHLRQMHARMRESGRAAGMQASETLHVETEEDAVALVHMIVTAGDTDSMALVIQRHETEFNQVFAQSILLNVQDAVKLGDPERARTLTEFVRFIVMCQHQSLSITSTLLTQLIEEDRQDIVHLGPGARFTPVREQPELNRRVAEEMYRDGLRLLAGQRYREALARFEDCLELFEHLRDDEHVTECLGNLAYCASRIGQFEAAMAYGQRALTSFRAAGNDESAARVLLILGGIQQQAGQLEESIRTYEEAQAAARAARSSAIEASAVSNIGAAWQQLGNVERALEWQERALTLKRVHADPESLAGTLSNLGILYREAGELDKGDTLLAEAREIVEGTGDRQKLAILLNNQALDVIRAGTPQLAEPSLHRARQLAAAIGDPYLELQIVRSLAAALRAQGKWAAIDDLLSSADELGRGLSGETGRRILLMLRAEVAASRGDYPAVAAAIEELLAHHAEQLSPVQRIAFLSNLWISYSSLNRSERAADCRAQLLRLIEQNTSGPAAEGDPELFLHSCRAHVSLACQGEADVATARSLLSRAIHLAERLHLTNQLAELYEDEASLLRTEGKQGDAVESHRRALGAVSGPGHEGQRASILANLATALRELGQLQESADTYGQALDLVGLADSQRAQILVKLAAVTIDLGRHDDAEAALRHAAEFARLTSDRVTAARASLMLAGDLLSAGNALAAEEGVRAVLEDEEGLSRELLAEALGVHALTLRDLKRYEEAIADIDRAVAIGQHLPIDRAATLFYAGVIYWEGGRREGVIERLDQALALIPDQAASPLTANIREQRGDVFVAQGDLVAAEREYDLAAGHVTTLRRDLPFEQDRFQLAGRFGSVAEKRAHLLLRQQRFAEAFAAIEAARSRAFAERLGLGDLHPPRAVPADIRERERQLLERARHLELSLPQAGSARQRERLAADYTTTMQSYNRLLDEIALDAPEYAEWRRGATITFADVRALLST